MDLALIRNFCIIAHIDHGKSTLADRLLERTGTISSRDMAEQVLDTMDLEREKGITIKAQAVRMPYTARDGRRCELNLIDTPGHVDFTYEVSRSLAACEGALVVVDAAQGIEAQTLANVYLAMEHDLKLIPVVNKIDLPSAEPERVAQEIVRVLGLPADEIIFASAKDGTGTDEILEAVVQRIPPPTGDAEKPLRALIFDSHYDLHKGVVAYVRLMDGMLTRRTDMQLMSTGRTADLMEIGYFAPRLTAAESLQAGEVGYIATGLKNVKDCRVGDTVTDAHLPAAEPLPGYQPANPMVFAGIYPTEGEDYPLLRDALERLQLNDAALSFEPETSQALGFGFRCGFLGMLHMQIVQERLEREYELDLLATAPSVEYEIVRQNGQLLHVDNPADFPNFGEIQEIREPWMDITVIAPSKFIGAIMELVTSRRGEFAHLDYLDEERVLLRYRLPLADMIVEFYDRLKTITQGYASLDYSVAGYRAARLVRVDILVNNQVVDALSLIVAQDRAFNTGKAIVDKLRELIPRQLFEVPIQAAIGSKVVARETVKALRKNVLAKCYGGDISRKRKLLEKQKEGKARMKRFGNVEIPQDAFMALLKL
ncbi:MAG TPA: translation elongation factor 4 [Chloroflexota bacterium]|nr:translation elongation factor 4 [Chloroflexota bacterium]